MKARNTSLYCSVISKIQHYRLDKLFMVFLLSLSVVACDGGSSSNKTTSSNECSDDFGDKSRCEQRKTIGE